MKSTILLGIVAVVLWMALIIGLSHQPAPSSDALSFDVTERIVAVIERLVPGVDLNPRELNHAVRKYAHFSIYFVLGILVARILTKLGVRGFRCAAFALLICVLFATSDELHQLFVVGRGAQVTDVFIDSAGAAIGIALLLGIMRLRRRSRNKHYSG